MVDPQYFDVAYVINPHMKTSDGQLKKVDRVKARLQWNSLKDLFEALDLKVAVLPAVKGLFDMVFAANQSLPFRNLKTNELTVLMSVMKAPERKLELLHFERWYKDNGYRLEKISDSTLSFEGCGDALLNSSQNQIWGGYGFRTDLKVYEEIQKKFGFEVIPLKLINPDFYHLDTCIAILNPDTVVVFPDAFESQGLQDIRRGFKEVIELDSEESITGFAANCFCPNGRDVIVQKGNRKFIEKVTRLGFRVHEVDTGEFIKSGGSVFCLKMQLPD